MTKPAFEPLTDNASDFRDGPGQNPGVYPRQLLKGGKRLSSLIEDYANAGKDKAQVATELTLAMEVCAKVGFVYRIADLFEHKLFETALPENLKLLAESKLVEALDTCAKKGYAVPIIAMHSRKIPQKAKDILEDKALEAVRNYAQNRMSDVDLVLLVSDRRYSGVLSERLKKEALGAARKMGLRVYLPKPRDEEKNARRSSTLKRVLNAP